MQSILTVGQLECIERITCGKGTELTLNSGLGFVS